MAALKRLLTQTSSTVDTILHVANGLYGLSLNARHAVEGQQWENEYFEVDELFDSVSFEGRKCTLKLTGNYLYENLEINSSAVR